MKLDLKSMVAGTAILLFVKYIVLGLNKWDSIFHPQRIEPLDSPFLKGLFG